MCVIRHGGKTTTKPGSETDRTPWRSYGTSPSDSSASTANTRSKKRPKRSAETGTEPSTYYSPKVTIMTDGNHDAALGGRHRDWTAGLPDGQRGLLSGERPWAGDERRGSRLPRALSAPARRKRPVRGPEPGPGTGQQLLPDRLQCGHLLPARRLGHPDRHVRRRVGRHRLSGADHWAARLQRRLLVGGRHHRHPGAAAVPGERAVGQLDQGPHHRAIPAHLRKAGLPEEPVRRPRALPA